jgi:hypothetical protein
MFGLTMEEAEEARTIQIWPDCLESVNVFIAMGTQWRVGNNGASGLDYNALPVVMEYCEVKDQKTVFHDLRVMEDAALSTLKDNKK